MRWLRRDSILLDAMAAAVFLVAGVIDAATNDLVQGPRWANVATMVLLAGLVLVRRRFPLPAAYAFLALMAFQGLVLTPPPDMTVPLFGLLLFPYAAAAHAEGRWSRAVLLALPVAIFCASFEDALDDLLFPNVMGWGAWLAGRSVRTRTRLAAELHEAALQAEEAREGEARRAMATERRRIAREMHDVVAHSISVMVVQAGGARRILERDPERAEAAAAEIERTGREALLEMRRLLGVMQGPKDKALYAPAPTFADLPQLLERARVAGAPVEFVLEGTARELPPGVDLSAYRVIQEALSNTLRHAPGAPVEVVVRWLPERLELHVTDRGPGPVPTSQPTGSGQGLIGMRERVAMYGGELRTGHRRGGGYEVHATFPLDGATDPGATPPIPARGAA